MSRKTIVVDIPWSRMQDVTDPLDDLLQELPPEPWNTTEVVAAYNLKATDDEEMICRVHIAFDEPDESEVVAYERVPSA